MIMYIRSVFSSLFFFLCLRFRFSLLSRFKGYCIFPDCTFNLFIIFLVYDPIQVTYFRFMIYFLTFLHTNIFLQFLLKDYFYCNSLKVCYFRI